LKYFAVPLVGTIMSCILIMLFIVANLENIYVNSNGNDTNVVGNYNVYNFNGNPASRYNSNLVGKYFESRLKTSLAAQTIQTFKTLQLGYCFKKI